MVVMLETISETSTLDAALPPRPIGNSIFEGSRIKTDANYGDDQDSTFGDEEYARSYTASQVKKAPAPSKRSVSEGSSPASNASDQSPLHVHNTSAGQEPLYGDPGEEDDYNSKHYFTS